MAAALLVPLASWLRPIARPMHSVAYYRAHPDEMQKTLSVCGEFEPMPKGEPRCKPAAQVRSEQAAAAANAATAAEAANVAAANSAPTP